ncbi:MAG: hypothetical protein LBQ15_08065 [Clostridium sp.]|nr:hypothetical protein [Clostridium sp.]
MQISGKALWAVVPRGQAGRLYGRPCRTGRRKGSMGGFDRAVRTGGKALWAGSTVPHGQTERLYGQTVAPGR